MLDGMKVLDFTRMLPGGMCTLLLADLGADVTKVEDTGRGDYMRSLNAPVYEATNRNKRSICLDLKTEAGRAICLDLVRQADVLVESFRPGVMARLSLGYEEIMGVNPGLVYCSITGFGQTGPYRDRPGHDLNYLALSGLLHLNGHADRPPVPYPFPLVDLGPGGYASAFAILAAYIESRRTGKGRWIDLSLHDGAVTLNTPVLNYFATGQPDRRGESRFADSRPCYRVYETAEGGFIALGCLEEKFWDAFLEAIGRPDLRERQFDAGAEMRVEMEAIFRSRTRAAWAELLEKVETCWSPVLALEELADDPHIRSRELFVEVLQSGSSGQAPTRQLRLPFQFWPAVAQSRRAAPLQGEHTDQVLGELGLPLDRREALRRQGVIR